MEDNKQQYNYDDNEPEWMVEVLSKYGVHQIDDGYKNWRHTNGNEIAAFSGEIKGHWAFSVYVSTDKKNNITPFGSEHRVTTFYCAERLDEYMKQLLIEILKQTEN